MRRGARRGGLRGLIEALGDALVEAAEEVVVAAGNATVFDGALGGLLGLCEGVLCGGG
ncbi:MAG: hypothetical protein IBJ18_10470 [Phycisphaerales bacterium]|nr:hypothetical protein [Phycisphaerales bacterium]